MTSTLARFASCAALISFSSMAYCAELIVELKNVPSETGAVMIAVYDSEANFRQKAITQVMKQSTPGAMTISLGDLPAGQYSVAAYHDQNGDGELNSNFLGIPKEPWAASTGGKTIFGAPSWADTNFPLPVDGTRVVLDFD